MKNNNKLIENYNKLNTNECFFQFIKGNVNVRLLIKNSLS